jgi:Predicted membrane protein (DUF2306)
MTDAVWTYRRRPFADKALKSATILWYLVAVVGQWAFVYYIAAFYGASSVTGHFEAWLKNTNLIKGYVAHDAAGNMFFAVHVLIAAMITASGALQLVPQIRARAMTFHRWNGRFYILAAFLMATDGLWLIWARGTYTIILGALSSTLLASLIMVLSALTLRSAMMRKIAVHQRWALRTFMVVNAVWFQRLGYMAWVILNHGPVGIGDHLDGPFDIIWGFSCYLVPLAVLEAYMRTRDHAGATGKAVMATALFGLTALMGVGIFGAYMFMWRPLL